MPVPSAISETVSTRACLRPTRSAYAPITMLPSGRTTKPTPNVASDIISAPSSLPAGKNNLPISAAKKL